MMKHKKQGGRTSEGTAQDSRQLLRILQANRRISEVARQMGLSRTAIRRCLNGEFKSSRIMEFCFNYVRTHKLREAMAK